MCSFQCLQRKLPQSDPVFQKTNFSMFSHIGATNMPQSPKLIMSSGLLPDITLKVNLFVCKIAGENNLGFDMVHCAIHVGCYSPRGRDQKLQGCLASVKA